MDTCPHHPRGESPAPARSAGDPAGSVHWRSLAELAHHPAVEPYLQREFPPGASEWKDGVSRRNMLMLMAASAALAGVGGCYKPPERQIVPYVRQPEDLVPGRKLFFASTLTQQGYARPVLVEQHEGRPTKVEGNPDHPASLGGSDIFSQAAVLGLYDPDRSTELLKRGNTSTWGTFVEQLPAMLRATVPAGATSDAWKKELRLAVLGGQTTSPTLKTLWQRIAQMYPKARWFRWEPLGRDNSRAGSELAFNREVEPIYDFSKATRIVSLDADFLREGPGMLRHAREFAHRRRVRFKAQASPARARTTGSTPSDAVPTPETMNRLYVVESTVTATGAKADHRLPVRPSEVTLVARDLGRAVSGQGLARPESAHARFVHEMAQDLLAHRGSSLVLAGDCQPPEVHALAHALNAELGNVGHTVRYADPIEQAPGGKPGTLAELAAALQAGAIDALLILDSNPAYDAPVDLEFASKLEAFSLAKAPGGEPRHLTVHLGEYFDETANLCQWHIPRAHDLEAWGDARAYDGTASITQPLIAPIFGGKTAIELLAALVGDTLDSGHDILKAHWRQNWPDEKTAGDFDAAWVEALRSGIIPGSASPDLSVQAPALGDLLKAPPASRPQAVAPSTAIEVRFCGDPCIGDGRHANNGWLQELPKPIIRLTWDNAALLSAATAVRLGLAPANSVEDANEKLITLEYRGRKLDVAVWVTPGHPDDTVTLYLGYGRSRSGRVGTKIGFYTYGLRHSDAPWFDGGVKVHLVDWTYKLASTQLHQTMEGRDIARTLEINALADGKTGEGETPDLYSMERAPDDKHPVHLSLYPEYQYRGYKWGMVVDQTACIACNACVIACQAENNIPIVGKEQVRNMRQMHWIRIDTYFASAAPIDQVQGARNPDVLFQPMLCQQCENAPCEVVCPVEATTHSDEGINEMTYNRCVGTRYCSNNCPYKVRRFNFLVYSDYTTEILKLSRNPNVTVRWRGVMEKCNYCIQRINAGRIDEKTRRVREEAHHRPVQMRPVESDGGAMPEKLPPLEVLTACQQACPTEAIIFGDMNDADSYVHRLKQKAPWKGLEYGVLVELNTQPRTSYLKRLTNPNPSLSSRESHA